MLRYLRLQGVLGKGTLKKNGGIKVKALGLACCEKSCTRARGSARGWLALFFAVLCAVACMSCGMAGAAEAQAQDSQSGDELTSVVLGNFVLRIPSDATFEKLASSDVDAELQKSGVFNGTVDCGSLCRIEAADGTTVYAYACRALMDANDVEWANRTTDEVALQERGEWFASQLLYSDALLTTAVRYVGCLHYDVEEQPLTFFCFSGYVLRAGCAVGFVSLPSGYVSVIAFVFDLSQSAGAVSLVDGVVPLLEVGNGFTTAEMIEAAFEEDYEASGDALASYGITYGDEETGPYKDGYYESSMRSWTDYSPMVCIQVTDGKVSAVEVADNLAYLGFGAAALEQLPSAIVAANGIEGVDAVSGATLTSEFILSAAQDCLVQATACPFDATAREGLAAQAEVDFGACYRCHDDNLEKTNHAPSRWQSTEDQVINPHDMPAIDAHAGVNITCDDCHVVGEAPVMMCAQCHDGIAEVPGGWTIPDPSINALAYHMDVVPLDTCGSCHDGAVVRELDMAQASAGYSWCGEPFDFHDMSADLKNGHAILLGNFDCQTCHAERSVATCVTCHAGVFTEETLPWGWTAGAGLTDGSYTAEGKGIGGKVPVTVEVKDGKIAEVTVGDNSETQGIGSKAIEQLPEAIVAANGTEGVDAVSGATVTSKAVFSAVDECLEQAEQAEKADKAEEPAAEELAAETESLIDGTYTASARCSGGIVPVTVTYEDGGVVCIEIENDSALVGDDFKAVLAAIIGCRSQAVKAAVEIDRTAVENAAAATEFSVDAAIEAASATEPGPLTDGALTDGTYTASGKGFDGEVPVTVTIEGGKIASVTVGYNYATSGIGLMAINQLPAKIVAANGTEGVDAVSGATVTSKAIFTAVNSCLKQAAS